jgi:hypothetical protein
MQGPVTRYLYRPGRGAVQKAHYVRDGHPDTDAPLCATLVHKDGRRLFAPFLCSWVALHPKDTLCGICRRVLAGRAAGRGAVAPG